MIYAHPLICFKSSLGYVQCLIKYKCHVDSKWDYLGNDDVRDESLCICITVATFLKTFSVQLVQLVCGNPEIENRKLTALVFD